ncbi:bifunctional diguanylate cyclase/phosphodiesterase [Ammoniphilus sp. CFH 90114]|uniref:putative bifunctional diguanylate cyclase/phosphodiesterase n=1 Tax=Ammoniphilus sp. CFH 90114 TaxID=2493665 RepID=UPI0013E9253E|nr:GGDEF domain-containing phosphodiesterase [Ammoniphilus sp. CFH 90114]
MSKIKESMMTLRAKINLYFSLLFILVALIIFLVNGMTNYLFGSIFLLVIGLIQTRVFLQCDVLSRITQLDRTIQQIKTTKDLSIRADVKQNDEISSLTSDFNLLIGTLEQLHEEKTQVAHFDSITHLPNRKKFYQDLEQQIQEVSISSECVGVALMDLDRFKVINETLGPAMGDQLLEQVARRLDLLLEDYGIPLYRIGGDEFIFILSKRTEKEMVEVLDQILEAFQQHFLIQGQPYSITTSIGVSIYPRDGNRIQDILKNADLAMYQVKGHGKKGYLFYTEDLQRTQNRKFQLEQELAKALEQGEFHIVYQPKVNARTETVIGMEALLRWKHNQLGYISPAEFIPIAEEIGLIVEMGKWVLRKACEQNQAWIRQGLPPLVVSVNLSTAQFHETDFVDQVVHILQNTGMNPEYLELEITESLAMRDIKQCIQILEDLKKLGIHISMDDFGTGYSSLRYLQQLPIDTLKIDKSFIDAIGTEDKKELIVTTIIAMANILKIKVIAEGVEERHQVTELLNLQCEQMQGYYFSKPLSPGDFQLFRHNRNNNLHLREYTENIV